MQAQQFTTGDNEGGYTLSEVVATVGNLGFNSRPRVGIYSDTSTNHPDSSLYVLTNPALFAADGNNSFNYVWDSFVNACMGGIGVQVALAK